MAALLRSARFLKISASPLLQLKGTRRHAATASAVHSRAVCRIAAGPRGALSSLFPYSSASVCSSLQYSGTASEQKGEYQLLAIRNKQANNFDWALSKLDSSVRRTGRVTKTLLQKIFQDICRNGHPSGNHALLLLRSCGSLLPEEPVHKRTDFAHHIWKKLQGLGVTYDVSHYNALLKVYLQNEFKFSPTDFLDKMEAANVEPNRVTYQRLIAAYCQDGDIEGASKILAFMKSRDLPITEAVFNSLLTGHARAGDMESAVNILSVMRGAGIDPGPDTYLTLLCAYAENGDIAKIKETIDTLQNTGTSLMDRELLQVVFSLAKSGHQQHVPEILALIRHDKDFVAEAMNLSLSLITLGMADTAYAVLQSFPVFQAESQIDRLDMGNFFLRHCVNMNMPVEKLNFFCNSLRDENFHSSPQEFTLRFALESKNTAMAVGLMKIMKEDGFPIRPHYFWPLLIQHQKNMNVSDTVEVLKAMQELDVVPDTETYTMYVLNNFPSVDSAQAALKDAGFDLLNPFFFLGVARFMALKGLLSELASLMSSSIPAIDVGRFNGILLTGFRRSRDVESMVKITELLYKDSRYVQEGQQSTENVGHLVYRVFKLNLPEEMLREYLDELKKRNITIPVNIYRGIKKVLECNMPALIKHVSDLVDQKTETKVPYTPLPKDSNYNVSELESKLMESSGRPTVFRSLIKALCDEQNLSRALELKTQHEHMMNMGSYVSLIKLCLQLDNIEEAMKLKKELDLKGYEGLLNDSIYVNLVIMLSKHNRLDEAIDLLKEMKAKKVRMRNKESFFDSLLELGDIEKIRRLQDTVFTLGIADPSNKFCAPIIMLYLDSGDLPGALEAVIDCSKIYRQLPQVHNLTCAMIEKGDTELLQKAMDFVSKEHGEMVMMYELFFGFLWTGRYKEARRIIETPGLRAKPGKLQWFAEKCINAQQMAPLETLVDLTAKLFDCDRDEMHHYVLRLCKKTNNWQKAETVWMKIQEENLVPREKTLLLLADILKSNNQKVPFELPEAWYEQPEAKEKSTKLEESHFIRSPAGYSDQVLKLCKKGKSKDALNILKEAVLTEIPFKPTVFNVLIKALMAEGNIEDGLAVKDIAVKYIPEFRLSDTASSLQIVSQVKLGKLEDALATLKAMINAGQVPLGLACKRLVQGLGSQGDVNGILDVQELLKEARIIHPFWFVDHTVLAHIKNGDIDIAVEMMESVCIKDRTYNASVIFQKLIEANNENALDKLSAMAERLCNHFALYRPATYLFLQYLDQGKTEEAKFLLQRCVAVAEQRPDFVRYMVNISRNPGQVTKLKNLRELVPDFIEESRFCCYLMKCYAMDKDLSSAKTLYQQMQDDGTQVDELTLKRLARLYRDAGEEVPFEEPLESFQFYADKLRTSEGQSSTEN